MDSLTLVVKVLDIFVLLVKAFGVGMLGATAALLIKLLPKRIRVAVNMFAAAFLFVAFLSFSSFSLFSVTAIRLGIWAVGFYIILQAVVFEDILQRKNFPILFDFVGADGTCVSLARGDGGASYFASYLRRTPVMLN